MGDAREPVLEEPEPEPEPIAADEAHAVLTGVLDTLGAAHHRPFSRRPAHEYACRGARMLRRPTRSRESYVTEVRLLP